jgi:hypothetical protein
MFEEEIWSEHIDIGSKCLEYFKYLGSSVNGDNSIEEEIKELLLAFKHTVPTKIFKSKFISQKAKLKLCWTIM